MSYLSRDKGSIIKLITLLMMEGKGTAGSGEKRKPKGLFLSVSQEITAAVCWFPHPHPQQTVKPETVPNKTFFHQGICQA